MGSLLSVYLSTLLLMPANPLTILSFAAAFAALGLVGSGGGFPHAAALVSGVFAGSALWWLLLSGGVGWFRAHIGPSWPTRINRISGVILAAFGLAALLTLVL